MPERAAPRDSAVTGPIRSGFVSLVGRPNSGKSTLVNALVGSKVAITSDTPQTTRHRLRGIVDLPEAQIVLVDTPGLHKPEDALGEELNRSALKALEDADVVAMLIDATRPVGRGDAWVAAHVQRARGEPRRVLVITKADIATEQEVASQREAALPLASWDRVFVVSAVTREGLDELVSGLVELLPEGPRWFPRDMPTDQPLDVIVAEFVREKVLRSTYDEVPHAVGVSVDDIEQDPDRDLARVFATIYVERESQKGIIIGKGGALIKRVGTEARADLERLLGMHVYLDLKVKVRKDWRRDATQIRRFGYGEGL